MDERNSKFNTLETVYERSNLFLYILTNIFLHSIIHLQFHSPHRQGETFHPRMDQLDVSEEKDTLSR
jgi:hypothetical protein